MRTLKTIRKKHSGRSNSGKVVVRHQGGAHKRFLRNVDFKREKKGVTGIVAAIEYDPNRSADVALIHYSDGDKKYILAPRDLKLKDSIIGGPDADLKPGNSLPLSSIPIGTFVHNIELTPGRGGQMARSGGTAAIVQAKEGKYVHLKLPSGEVRKFLSAGYASVGVLGNAEWKNKVFGTAGAKRRRGIRPTVRGVAQNPRSHPHGGGEGRSGIGLKSPKTYAGRKAVGKTRNPKKYSNSSILKGRGKGKK